MFTPRGLGYVGTRLIYLVRYNSLAPIHCKLQLNSHHLLVPAVQIPVSN